MFLVTGATGTVGRIVVDLLVAQRRPVRALSRTPHDAAWPDAVDVVAGDLCEPGTLDAALDGVSAVFLFAAPGSGPGFVAAATRAGVRHVVLLSSGAVVDGPDQDGPIATYHADIEQALRSSTLTWTFLRPDVFAANALMWAGQLRTGDVVRGAYADATAAPVHEADIAAVAVTALTGVGHDGHDGHDGHEVHEGQIYRLTGPGSLSHADQARLLGEVLGRTVRFEELPPDVVRQAMSAHVPGPVLDSILATWAASAGRPATTTTDVEKLTGRPARSFRDWVADHADAFAPAPRPPA